LEKSLPGTENCSVKIFPGELILNSYLKIVIAFAAAKLNYRREKSLDCPLTYELFVKGAAHAQLQSARGQSN
jgi:hypothetical protein